MRFLAKMKVVVLASYATNEGCGACQRICLQGLLISLQAPIPTECDRATIALGILISPFSTRRTYSPPRTDVRVGV